MRLSDAKIYRIAERLHDELAQRGLLIYRDAPGSKPMSARAERIKAIISFIEADLRIEEEIDAEVEQILDSYQRTLKPSERDTLRQKHKEEIANRRNYQL